MEPFETGKMDLRLCGKIAFQINNGKPIQWYDITTELREIYSEAFKMEASRPIKPSNKDKRKMINFINIDERNGNTFNEEIVMNPTWADSLHFLRKLDGDKFTLAFFEASDTDSALVGGGPEYFVVSITMDDNIYTLMNDKQGNIEISLVIGGQLGNYCDNICIELMPMLEVLKYFYETGKLHEAHQWKQE